MLVKNKTMYSCEYCDYSSRRKTDYERHLSTDKHEKMRKKKIENSTRIDVTPEKKIKPEKTIAITFYCDKCKFTCNKKKEYVKHSNSTQHNTSTDYQGSTESLCGPEKTENKEEEIVKQYTCVKCDKCYSIYASCWKHLKTCQGKHENIVIENAETPAEICLPIKKEKLKRKTIPLALRRSVWNKYIGEEIGKTACLCCKISDISQMTFSCGHIVSVYNGGDINLENLKPICVSCNSSMGSQNMDEFIQNYGL